MQVGIVGLPNVGKSTLFNALTKAGAEIDLYPFTTVEPNVGMVEVPDERLYKVQELAHSAQAVPTSIKFLDIAGLVRGASKGEGLGNQFLSYIRDTDVIVHVVRTFERGDVAHVEGKIDPAFDIDIVNLELMLADLAIIDRRVAEAQRHAKAGDKEAKAQVALLEKLKEALGRGTAPRKLEFADEEKETLKDIHLLTLKPVIYVANIGEKDISKADDPQVKAVFQKAKEDEAEAIAVSAEIEAEIAELENKEAKEFREDLGIKESSLEQLIHTAYKLLNLITFFTANPNEAHAWTVAKGTRAQEAAGKVHSDMARGFIRAEVVSFEELVKVGSVHTAKEKGTLRLEGKDYVVQDGEIIYFRFAT